MTTKRTKTNRTVKAPWVRRPRRRFLEKSFHERPSVAERKYHEYHSLENTTARFKADQDVKQMRKVRRIGGRLDLMLWRNRYYQSLKTKKEGAK